MTNPETTEHNAPRLAIPLWAWAAAVAIVLLFAMALWQAQKLQRQLAELRNQVSLEQSRKDALEVQRREIEQIRALVSSPGTRSVSLRAAGAPPVRAFWNEELGVLLSAQKLPAAAPGRAFQLWVVPKKGTPISAGVFRPDAAGNLFLLTRVEAGIKVNEARALAISEEPAGGSPQPTSKLAWVGPIS